MYRNGCTAPHLFYLFLSTEFTVWGESPNCNWEKHSEDVRLLFCLLDSSSFHPDGMDKKVDKFPVSLLPDKSVELSSLVCCWKYLSLTEGPAREEDVHWGKTTFLCKSPASESPVKCLVNVSWSLMKRNETSMQDRLGRWEAYNNLKWKREHAVAVCLWKARWAHEVPFADLELFAFLGLITVNLCTFNSMPLRVDPTSLGMF